MASCDGEIGLTADTFDVSPLPRSVVAADLNGDGIPDLAGSTSSALSVLFNQGDGTFAAPLSYPTTLGSAVVAADLNGDGRIDLAVADSGSILVGVYINEGGSFADAVWYNAGGGPSTIAAADLNGDGKPDLAVTNFSQVSVLMNQGDGTFGQPVTYLTGWKPTSIVAADFNSDGVGDLAIAGASDTDDQIRVLLNKGDGSFTERQIWSFPGAGPKLLTTADLNGDLVPDLVFAHNNCVSVFWSSGKGPFTSHVDFCPVAPESDYFSAAVGDLNGDGAPDLLATNEKGNRVEVFFNRGNGTFDEAAVSYDTGSPPTFLATSDLNSDGKIDVVAVNLESSITVLLNNGCLP
jgi:hypothetical protein